MGRRRIVAGESDSSSLTKLKEILFRLGYTVVGEATDGMTALKFARAIQPDLVLLNTQLVGMDGLKVAKILEEESIVPSLIITERAGRDLISQIQDSFFISCIVKPIRPQQLFTAIEQALANYDRFKKLDQQLEQLKKNLAERKTIERAKAILMSTKNVSEDEAHRLLQQLSMKKRQSITEIAVAVTTAYELER